jgi:hypothetical protein
MCRRDDPLVRQKSRSAFVTELAALVLTQRNLKKIAVGTLSIDLSLLSIILTSLRVLKSLIASKNC